MLGEAQTAYARSGDTAVRDTLVDIIARRSKAKNASREALTLNDAAARAPRLTIEEFSTLSLAYICRYTVFNGLQSVSDFNRFLANTIMPLFETVSMESTSFWHIEAQSLGRTNILSGIDLRTSWAQNYGGLLGTGLTMEQARSYMGDGRVDLAEKIVVPCVRDTDKFQPKGQNLKAYLTNCEQSGATEAELSNMWNMHGNTIPQGDAFWSMLEKDVPGIAAFGDFWEKTSIKGLELNSVGIAIAHANAKRVVGLDAPLSIWIR